MKDEELTRTGEVMAAIRLKLSSRALVSGDRLPSIRSLAAGSPSRCCRQGGLASRHRQSAMWSLSCPSQSTPASTFSFCTSSATEPTFTPALRPPGSAVFTTFRRGETSTPSVSGDVSSRGFFLAFMMLGSDA